MLKVAFAILLNIIAAVVSVDVENVFFDRYSRIVRDKITLNVYIPLNTTQSQNPDVMWMFWLMHNKYF